MRALFQVFSFDLASKVLIGILGILLIRYLPQKEYAAYTFALALVTFSSQSLVASFNRIYIVAYQRLRIKDSEFAFISLQLLLIGGLILIGSPLSLTFGYLYWTVAALAVASCLSEFSKTSFQKDLQFLTYSLIEFCRSLLFFGCTLVLIQLLEHELTAQAVLLCQVAAWLGVSCWVFRKRISNVKSIGFSEIPRVAVEITKGEYRYLFAYFFILGVFTQTDIFMLELIGNSNMLATYGSALRYYAIVSLALGAVHVVLLPMIQQASNDKELLLLFARHRKIILVFGPVVGMIAWLSQWLIPLIDNGKYPEAILAFRILCISAIISFAFSPHVNLVMRFERFQFLFRLICVALIINIVINYFLIPHFGASGVAISTLVSAAAVTVPIYFHSRQLVARHFENQ